MSIFIAMNVNFTAHVCCYVNLRKKILNTIKDVTLNTVKRYTVFSHCTGSVPKAIY